MAYSNWGAVVYRNGVRMYNREDVGVYDEEDAEVPVHFRIWANLLRLHESGKYKAWLHAHHAVLGDGEVRLCGYKDNPVLWIWKEGEQEPQKVELITDDELLLFEENEFLQKEGEITVNGKTWKWKFKKQFNLVELELVEPDGTVWTAISGFEYGDKF